MSFSQKKMGLLALAGILSLAAPFMFPNLVTQLAFFWVMVIFALTWDIMGGQMGYNSFGNIVFFGIGAYTSAVIQRDLGMSYFAGLALGASVAMIVSFIFALIVGMGILRMRGQYFAICTLGLGVAVGELASGIEYIGAGSGMVTPVYPNSIDQRNLFFYFLFFILAVVTFFTFKWLYASRFGLGINAIRDDEDKAEAMGLWTTGYKVAAWGISAFFLGITGALVGNLIGFIDSRDVAFASATYGVWMVLMAILGGSGSLWGPVVGAAVFHLTQELFWAFLLGWQRVALGLLIVVIVLFFPTGIIGFIKEKWPHRFNQIVEDPDMVGQKGEGA